LHEDSVSGKLIHRCWIIDAICDFFWNRVELWDGRAVICNSNSDLRCCICAVVSPRSCAFGADRVIVLAIWVCLRDFCS
jgi:hypothetical protein